MAVSMPIRECGNKSTVPGLQSPEVQAAIMWQFANEPMCQWVYSPRSPVSRRASCDNVTTRKFRQRQRQRSPVSRL